MKLNRKWLLIVSLVMSVALATSGTLAYLTDTKADVNVMTLGSVYIEQIEQERNAAGELVDYTQNKPLFPAVGAPAWNDEKININGHDYNMFGEKLKNAVDKIVSVKNTGKSDAYVRTIIALEDPFGDDMIGINVGGDGYTRSSWETYMIDGVQYSVSCFTYDEAVKPGEVTLPSLLQVYLNSKADNDDVAKLGEAYEIIALSQAVQTAGFDSAEQALNTAFGEVTEAKVLEWLKAEGVTPVKTVSTADELTAALAAGGTVVLNDDINLADAAATMGHPVAMYVTKNVTLDLAGQKIYVDGEKLGAAIGIENGGNLTITGNGTIECDGLALAFVSGGSTLNIENGSFTHPGLSTSAVYIEATPKYSDYYKDVPATINIYGGTFDCGSNPIYLLNEQAAFENQSINVYGGTFRAFDPSNGNDGNYLAEGYSVTKAADRYIVSNADSEPAVDVVTSTAELTTAIQNGATEIYLNAAGNYTIPNAAQGKELTIVGTKDTVIQGTGYGQNIYGASLSFEGVTIQGQTSGNHGGITHVGPLEFKNCTFEGKMTLYSDTTFTNCTFNNKNDYSIWTWGAGNVEFDGCTFNSGGKALLVYGEWMTTNVTVKNCVFNDDDTLDTQKAAIETGEDNTSNPPRKNYFDIKVSNTKVNGFAVNPEGISSNSTLWANKSSMPADGLNVTVDGVVAY